MKSVRQIDRRKPSVLYYPDACEEDTVHTSMMQNYESEMNNSKMLYKTAKLIRKRIVDFTDENKKSDIVILQVSYPSAILLSVPSVRDICFVLSLWFNEIDQLDQARHLHRQVRRCGFGIVTWMIPEDMKHVSCPTQLVIFKLYCVGIIC